MTSQQVDRDDNFFILRERDTVSLWSAAHLYNLAVPTGTVGSKGFE